MTTIANNLQQVNDRISQACQAAGRARETVSLLAVSKTFGAAAVAEAAAAGQRAFGENYIQEGVDKILALREMVPYALQWHCIGPIQSNKTRLVAEHFDWVHTVDRLKIAQRLSDQRPAHLPPLNVCIQVNVDGGIQVGGHAHRQGVPWSAVHICMRRESRPDSLEQRMRCFMHCLLRGKFGIRLGNAHHPAQLQPWQFCHGQCQL